MVGTLFGPQPRSLLHPPTTRTRARLQCRRCTAQASSTDQASETASQLASSLEVQELRNQNLAVEGQLAAATSPAPEAPGEQPARFLGLYNWLRFGGLPTARAATPPAAVTTAAPPSEQAEEPHHDSWAHLSDGMAAEPLAAAPAAVATERRGFLSLRRSGPPSPRPQAALDVIADPYHNSNHPALQLIRQRLAEHSRPGARQDDFKLGLVVEGGGMRGCVSGGALMVLADLGMRDVFDAVYGSSAGAINSTYFLSGQREGVHIYHDHIAHNEFIDLKRLWKSEPGGPAVLNLPYLLDYVMHDVCPLDWEAVLESEIPLKVVASSLDSLQPLILDDFRCKDDLCTSLRASANVPAIAGEPVLHRGHRLVDAAVFEAVPFRSAIADGCTHVLVLCTRPKRERRGVLPPLEDAIEAAIKKAILSPDYMVPAWKAEMEYYFKDGLTQDDMLLRSFDEGAHELPWFAGTHVFPLYPGPAASFSPLCTDVPTLKAGVAEGRSAAMRLAQALLRDSLEQQVAPLRDEVHESNILPVTAELSAAAKAGAAAGKRRGVIARFWRG